MKLGFIGTGKITSSVITGICNSKISFKRILVSPRNRSVAQKLKKQFKKVSQLLLSSEHPIIKIVINRNIFFILVCL